MMLPSLRRRNRGRGLPVRPTTNLLGTLQSEMNRLFDDFWHGFDLPAPFGEAWGSFSPRVDVDETDDEVRVVVDLPGLEEKDFEVQLAEGTLVLKGEKREEHEDRATGWRERTHGAFERAIPLPCEVDADHVSAQFRHGVLRVRLPKSAAARERPKRIQITAP